jgi:cytochrome c556
MRLTPNHRGSSTLEQLFEKLAAPKFSPQFQQQQQQQQWTKKVQTVQKIMSETAELMSKMAQAPFIARSFPQFAQSIQATYEHMNYENLVNNPQNLPAILQALKQHITQFTALSNKWGQSVQRGQESLKTYGTKITQLESALTNLSRMPMVEAEPAIPEAQPAQAQAPGLSTQPAQAPVPTRPSRAVQPIR